jgi:hypothetical protein
MSYAVEMDTGAMIYIPSFINICPLIQKLVGGDTHANKQTALLFHKPSFIFSK